MTDTEREAIKRAVRELSEIGFGKALKQYKTFDPEFSHQRFVDEVLDPAMAHLGEDGEITIGVYVVSTKVERPLATLRTFVAAHAQVMHMLAEDRLQVAIENAMTAQCLLGALEPEIAVARRTQRNKAGAVKVNEANFGKLRARACEIARAGTWTTRLQAGERIAEQLRLEQTSLGDRRLLTEDPGARVEAWLAEDLSEEEYSRLFPVAARARARHRARYAPVKNLCVVYALRAFSTEERADPLAE